MGELGRRVLSRAGRIFQVEGSSAADGDAYAYLYIFSRRDEDCRAGSWVESGGGICSPALQAWFLENK